MRKIPQAARMFATVALAMTCGLATVPPIFAQAPIFVLPSLDPTPAATAPAAHAMYPTNSPVTAPSTAQPSATPIAHPASSIVATPAAPRHHAQPEVTSEASTCRKRYADAVYNIGLALWTAPPPQHHALERLLNAAAAAQAVAMNPGATDQGKDFCSDATLNDLEATVVRLKAKGWVPLTEVEEHATRTTDVSAELKHAIAGISR